MKIGTRRLRFIARSFFGQIAYGTRTTMTVVVRESAEEYDDALRVSYQSARVKPVCTICHNMRNISTHVVDGPFRK